MPRLTRLATKTGDTGLTGLGDGSRAPKTDPRIAALGAVQEANAVLGVALAAWPGGSAQTAWPDGSALAAMDDGGPPPSPDPLADVVRGIQQTLFELGADLSIPLGEPDPHAARRLQAEQVDAVSAQLDAVLAQVKPAQSFVIPGGGAAHLPPGGVRATSTASRTCSSPWPEPHPRTKSCGRRPAASAREARHTGAPTGA